MTAIDYRRPLFTDVMPGVRVKNAERQFAFLEQAFAATLIDATRSPDGAIARAEIRIGDSLCELSQGSDEWPPERSAHHVYVPDPDPLYARAVAAGAASLMPPTDCDYGERTASVEDEEGNQWFIARRLEGPPRQPRTFIRLVAYGIL